MFWVRKKHFNGSNVLMKLFYRVGIAARALVSLATLPFRKPGNKLKLLSK